MSRKKIFKPLIVLSLLLLLIIYVCDSVIKSSAKGRLFSDEKEIPYNKVGLLLGASRSLSNGHYNPYYLYRIQAAVKLLKTGKIKYLVISGDNGRVEYNEPEAMKKDLMNAGIDSTKLILDYAGFRTFDSIKRLKEIFSQDSVTVISQQFHNERAIYIASKENIYAIGFNAKDVGAKEDFKIKIREKLARVKVILDFWFGKKPKFLGKKITIPK